MYLGGGGTIMKAIFAVGEESQENSVYSSHWGGFKFLFNLKIGFKYNFSRMYLLGRTSILMSTFTDEETPGFHN